MKPLARSTAKEIEYFCPPSIAGAFWKISPRGSTYNPYRLEEDKLQSIFIHIPKTAGTSITAALSIQQARHIPLVRYASFDRKKYLKYFKFAIARNPWDRFYSAYRGLLRTIDEPHSADGAWTRQNLARFDNFEEFVLSLKDRSLLRTVLRWTHFRPQYQWVQVPGDKSPSCDFIGRFENLQSDWDHIKDRIHINSDTLPVIRKGNNKPYTEVYSRDMEQIIDQVYKRDIDIFGYRFGGYQ